MSNFDRIELTSDIDQQAKLRRKLEEYTQRLAASRATRLDLDTSYKHRLLAELLEKGVVDVAEFRSSQEASGVFNPHAFDQAVQIITAYNANDTSLLRGGTGLS